MSPLLKRGLRIIIKWILSRIFENHDDDQISSKEKNPRGVHKT